MFSLLYDAILLLIGLVSLPKLLWQWARHGKYRESLKERLGFNIPTLPHTEEMTIWIHSCSLGETRAIIPLYKKIKEQYPKARIVSSTITQTGFNEARRSFIEAAAHFFLPLDFSWAIRSTMKKIRPDVLILVECEFWYHLLLFAKKRKASTILVNGRVSERSAERFAFLSSFSKRLFGLFDIFCLQTERYQKRFLKMGINPSKIVITGNLKFDGASKKLSAVDLQEWKENLGITKEDRVLVLGSTHEPEEEWLLSSLESVWKEIPTLKVLIVPRHPERFEQVAALLKSRNISCIRYSQKDQKIGDERVVLIDAMGMLHSCYQLSELAIVGGSFVDWVGGHNVFEPVECGIPVIFGPHMKDQLDLADTILSAKAGKQLKIEYLPDAVLKLLQNKDEYKEMQQAAQKLTLEMRGSTDRTISAIQPFFKKI